MKNPFKQKQKEMVRKTDNKFAGKRQYSIRTGLPEKTLKRLNDLHELLQCDPDLQGYVVTTFKEMNELTEMDVNIMTLMTQNGMIRKANTGGSPKFKYKWDTIKPTMDMAVKLLDKKLEKSKISTPMSEPEGVISESKPESIIPEQEEEKIKYEPGLRIPKLSVSDKPIDLNSIVIDSVVSVDGIMTMHINLKKLGITEGTVLNAVLALPKD